MIYGPGNLSPTLGCAAKLGSIVRHLEEACGEDGRLLDYRVVEGLLGDPEVQEWMAAMDAAALLPVIR